MLKLITEHYSREQNFEVAESIAKQAEIGSLTEIYFFQKLKKIREDMLNKDLTSALE